MRRLAFAAVALFLAGSLNAQFTPGQPPAAWFEPSTVHEQEELAKQQEYARFLAASPGRWNADFDPVLKTPRVILGSGLPLVAADADQNRVEKAVLQFLDEHAPLFGGRRGDFVIDGIVFSRDLWAVAVEQRHDGIPVHGAHISLAIKHGRLTLVQGVSHRLSGVETKPRLGQEEAIGKAGRALGVGNRRAGRERDVDASRAVILPERSPGAVSYRLAWEVTTRRERDDQPDVYFVSFIDALNGDVLAAYDGKRYADYTGTVTMEIEKRTVGDPIVTVPTRFTRVDIGSAAVNTDTNGHFMLANAFAPSQAVLQLNGPFVRVRNLTPPTAAVAKAIFPGIPLSHHWNAANSDPSERMTYRAVVDSNRFVATVFPTISLITRPIVANVNLNDVCNGFFDGTSINFFRGGSGCNATGRIFDVVAHEWGHALDFSAPGRFQDAALSEFIGDMVSFVQTDDFVIAPSFFTDGRAVRDLQDPEFECFNSAIVGSHDGGQLLGEVVWDIHEDLEAAGVTGEELKRLMVLPIALGQQRFEWFAAMLAVDDDDGNLANGTPHQCLIYRQFLLHSCAGERWIGVPLPTTTVSPSPAVLWPADHKLVPIALEAVSSNVCEAPATCRVTAVESSDPVDGLGDGDTSPDWVINGTTVMLRAERAGNGKGRVYSLTVECSDSSTSTISVTVPHDQRSTPPL